ncbi:hypothetical protein [Limnohabitans sp. T6-5]|nr:hypothetical protein [Limnohabitans sp. T6-5]
MTQGAARWGKRVAATHKAGVERWFMRLFMTQLKLCSVCGL